MFQLVLDFYKMIVNKNSFALLLMRIKLACAIAAENSSVSMFASGMSHRRLGRMLIWSNFGLFPNSFYMYTNIRWHFSLYYCRRDTFEKFWDFPNYFENMIIYLCNRSWKVNAKLACILYENEIKAIILIMIYHF